MKPEQAKTVLKAVTRADAVKLALASMRDEIAAQLKDVEERLTAAENLFIAHAQNRALVRYSEAIDEACEATGTKRESVFASATYDFTQEAEKVRVVITDGSAYDHRIRLVVDVDAPPLYQPQTLRQEFLRLREMQDPDAEEARANVLKDALDSTETGKQILDLLKTLRAECKR